MKQIRPLHVALATALLVLLISSGTTLLRVSALPEATPTATTGEAPGADRCGNEGAARCSEGGEAAVEGSRKGAKTQKK